MVRIPCMSARRLICVGIAAALACGLAACGSGSESTSATSGTSASASRAATGERFAAAAARGLARRCNWSSGLLKHSPPARPAVARSEQDRQLRSRFVAGSRAPVHLLIEASAVRPGARFQVAAANGGDRPIQYGTFNRIVNLKTGRTVPTTGQHGGTAQAFGVSAGTVGPCITASVPASTRPGRYRVVVQEARGLGPNGRLAAGFEVKGSPLPNPG